MSVDSPPVGAPAASGEGRPSSPSSRSHAWSRLASRRALVTAGLVAGVVVAVLVVGAAIERLAWQGKVLPGVEVASVSVAGTSEADAYDEIAARATTLEATPITARVDDTELTIEPAGIGLDVDAEATLRAARVAGRDGNLLDVVAGAALRRARADQVNLVVDYDSDQLDAVIDAWVRQTADGLRDGDLRFEGTTVVEVAPQAGTGIPREEARRLVEEHLRTGSTAVIELPTGRVTPAVDADDVAAAAAKARRMLAAPTSVTIETSTLTITPEQLAPTLVTRVEKLDLAVLVDPARLREALAPTIASFEIAPVDASWAVDGATATVVPSQPGRTVDVDGIAAAIGDEQRVVAAQLVTFEPARSTAWAQALNITEVVSSFTTNHSCCQNRVTNIHLAADAIDGAVVEPGQVFSMNETIGARTPEKGYVQDAAIAADLSYTQEYGGGVSQLATTVFNAVFFGGYEDVEHTVHDLYISRYPRGREATLNYPSIDLKFRNNSGSGVLVQTAYSGTSITVTFYGNREGKTVSADGPNVIEEIAPTVEYVDDPALALGEERQIQGGIAGQRVENFRIITRPGQPEVRERFVATYRMRPTRIARGTAPPAAPPPVPAAPPAEAPPLAPPPA